MSLFNSLNFSKKKTQENETWLHIDVKRHKTFLIKEKRVCIMYILIIKTYCKSRKHNVCLTLN